MKKLVVLTFIAVFLLAISVSVSAGDVPESLLYEDGSKVFVGTVENYTTKEISSAPYTVIDSIEVIPTQKIKGDIETGVKQKYQNCNISLNLIPGMEYLFGYLDENNFSVYEIEFKDENNIKLAYSNTQDMIERFERYLNNGDFARAENERLTIGKEISFTEFLYKKTDFDSKVSKIIFRYQDGLYEIDKDKFEKTAQNIMITNVKNEALYNSENDGSNKTVLYIELLDSDGRLISYGAVTKYGEVASFELASGKLMEKDYEMKSKDLEKLYSLFPRDAKKDVQKPENAPSTAENTPIKQTDKNFILWSITGVLLVFVIAFAIGYAVRKKQKNK